MSKHGLLQSATDDAAGDQAQYFLRRMRETNTVPLIVLGLSIEYCRDGAAGLSIGSLWGERLEKGLSDVERAELDRLLGELSKVLMRWVKVDFERLD